MDWFMLQVYTGYEKRAKKLIEEEIKRNNFQDKISQIFIPIENVVRLRKNKKMVLEKSLFPGYIFIHMENSKEMLQFLTQVCSQSTFLAGRKRPIKLKSEDAIKIEELLKNKDNVREVLEIPFRVGDNVKIISGPFKDFNGIVEEIDKEKEKMKVTVTIFGRSTPVELSFTQAELIGK